MKGTKVAMGILLVKNVVTFFTLYIYTIDIYAVIDGLGHYVTCYLAKNSHGVIATLEDSLCLTLYLPSVYTYF